MLTYRIAGGEGGMRHFMSRSAPRSVPYEL